MTTENATEQDQRALAALDKIFQYLTDHPGEDVPPEMFNEIEELSREGGSVIRIDNAKVI